VILGTNFFLSYAGRKEVFSFCEGKERRASPSELGGNGKRKGMVIVTISSTPGRRVQPVKLQNISSSRNGALSFFTVLSPGKSRIKSPTFYRKELEKRGSSCSFFFPHERELLGGRGVRKKKGGSLQQKRITEDGR